MLRVEGFGKEKVKKVEEVMWLWKGVKRWRWWR